MDARVVPCASRVCNSNVSQHLTLSRVVGPRVMFLKVKEVFVKIVYHMIDLW